MRDVVSLKDEQIVGDLGDVWKQWFVIVIAQYRWVWAGKVDEFRVEYTHVAEYKCAVAQRGYFFSTHRSTQSYRVTWYEFSFVFKLIKYFINSFFLFKGI